jgi:hypothetical protein
MRYGNSVIRGAGLASALVLAASVGTAAQQEVAGYSFETLAPVTDVGGTAVLGFAELPDGTLGVIGQDCSNEDASECTTLTWSSDDGGQTWTEAQPDMPGFAVTLLTHGDQFVAVSSRGGDVPTHGTFVWTSDDALTWDPAATLENVQFGSIQSTPDGLAIVGHDHRPAEGYGDSLAGYLTLWLSDDAVEWQASEVSAPLVAPDLEGDMRFVRAARADDGSWFISGRLGTFDPADEEAPPSNVWLNWHGSPTAGWTAGTPPVGAQDMNILFGSTAEGFFLSGADAEAGTSGIWLTQDGIDWEQVADTGGVPPVEFGTAVGGGAIAVKYAFENPGPQATLLDGAPVYSSADGRTWTDGGLVEGINVTQVGSTPDGRVLLAGGPAPCEDFVACVFFVGSNEVPVLMIGTPVS